MFLLGAAVLLASVPAVPGGELSIHEAAEFAEALVRGRAADGRAGDGRAGDGRRDAARRLRDLEGRAARQCAARPVGGVSGAAGDLLLVRTAVAEHVLRGALSPGALPALRAKWEVCHRAGGGAGARRPPAVPEPLSAKLPGLAADLRRVPGVAAVVARAVASNDRPTRIVPAEPVLRFPQGRGGGDVAFAETVDAEAGSEIRLSARLDDPAHRWRALPDLVFEAFNCHLWGARRELCEAAGRGELSRHECVWAFAALEELVAAQEQRVYLDHLGALRKAGVNAHPASWRIVPGLVGMSLPGRPSLTIVTAGYPHGVFGTLYDDWRLHGGMTSAAPDFWEAAVLLDRLRLLGFHRRGRDFDRVAVWDSYLAARGGRTVAYRVHQGLPIAVRAWLAKSSVGPSAARIARAWGRLGTILLRS